MKILLVHFVLGNTDLAVYYKTMKISCSNFPVNGLCICPTIGMPVGVLILLTPSHFFFSFHTQSYVSHVVMRDS